MRTQDEMVAEYVKLAVSQVERGQSAAAVMGNPVVAEYFEDAAHTFVRQALEFDPGDLAGLERATLRYQAIRDLHNHLTGAVTAGLTAARSLSEQAKREGV